MHEIRRAAKAAAKAKAEAAVKAAKAGAEAEAAKTEAKARDAEAKADEKARKTAAARERLDAQKTPQPLPDDEEDDGLGGWLPPSPHALPEIIVAGGERPNVADAGLAAMAAARVPFYQRGKDLVRVCLIKLHLASSGCGYVPH